MRYRSFVLGAGLCLIALPAFAEWDLALYGGAAHTPKSDVTMVIGSPSGPADHTFHNVKWDPSAEFGIRTGYWFAAVPWYGVGLDVFTFDANIPTQLVDVTIQGSTSSTTLHRIDAEVTAFALDIVRLRYRAFISEAFPNGQIQPYLTAGPAAFRTTMTNKENGELTMGTAKDTAIGYKLGAGLVYQFSRTIAMFGEYRYTHFHTEPNLQGTITGAAVPTRFDLNTHHLVAGVSVSF